MVFGLFLAPVALGADLWFFFLFEESVANEYPFFSFGLGGENKSHEPLDSLLPSTKQRVMGIGDLRSLLRSIETELFYFMAQSMLEVMPYKPIRSLSLSPSPSICVAQVLCHRWKRPMSAIRSRWLMRDLFIWTRKRIHPAWSWSMKCTDGNLSVE